MLRLTPWIADTVANAYAMCNNQPSAVPATHATIIATLIVPPTGPVVVPNPSTTATVSSNKSSTTSYMTPSVTMDPTSSTSSVLSSSSTFITRTSSSLSSSSSAPSSATAAPQTSETGAAAAPTRLSTAQIGGIAGGSIAAVLVAGVLALWCFMRRRRGKAVTGFYRVRDSWSPRRKDSPEISAPQYREPKSMSFTRALAQRANRASARPDTIGLAISPEGTGMQGAARQPGESMVAANAIPAAAHLAQRRSPSPPPIPALSPLRTQGNFNFFAQQGQPTQQQSQQTRAAKPGLTVAIPAAKPQPANRSSTMSNNRMPFSGGRDSVVTEFAEDGETSAGLGSAQIWRPPNTDPQSASTYYVADKWGNWVLGGGSGPEEHIVEMPTPVSKTVAERDAEQDRAVQESNAVKAAVKDLSSPTMGAPVSVRTSRAAGAPGRPTIRHVAPESGRLPINTRSSSVYSNFSMNFSLPQTVQPGPNNPMPNSAGSRKEPSPNPESYYAGGGAGGKQQGRDLTSRQKRRSSSIGGATRDRTNTMMSQDSATTIASSIGSEVGVDSFPAPSRQSAATEQQGNLSPVVESPGRSPVSYPKIPRPRSNAPLNRPTDAAPPVMKPLQHPALRVVNTTPSDSPTLGVVDSQKPVQIGGSQAAAAPAQARVSYYNPPRRNPNPNRNPGQVRSGSPETPSDQVPRPLAVPSNTRDTTKSPPLQSFQQHINNRSQLPSQSHSRYGPMSVYDAYARPDSNAPPQPPQQQHPLLRQQPSKQQQQYYYQQQQKPQQPQQPYQYQNEPGGPYSFSPSPSPASASESPSVSNTTIKTDSQSSLLAAKRLGAERAAALQIGQGDTVEARQARWKRRTSSLGKTGPVGGADDAPQGVVYRQAGRKPAAGNSRESDIPLPATPGWKPQLTPKRRGDDLFLSVQ